MKKTVIALAVLGLTSCSPEASKDANQLKSSEKDTKLQTIAAELETLSKAKATPDQAIESFVAFRDKASEAACYAAKAKKETGSGSEERISAAYRAFFTGNAAEEQARDEAKTLAECLASRERLSLDIREIKVETPTRAIVLANLRNSTPVPAGAAPDEYDTKRRKEGTSFRYQLSKGERGWQVAQVYRYDDIIDNAWEPMYEDHPEPVVPTFVWPV